MSQKVVDSSKPKPPQTAYKLPVPPPAPSAAPAKLAKSIKAPLPQTSKASLTAAPITPKTRGQKRAPSTDVSAPIPAWKTLDFDLDHWEAVFKEIDLDTVAQQELYLLAQFSDLGAKAANQIVGKVLKKVSDGQAVRNWSAFVHVAVKDVRHQFWHELQNTHGSSSNSRGSQDW